MNSGVSKKKLFISNLDFEVTSDQLRGLFEELGGCISVVVASDRETKRSKGFAFVEMDSEDDAKKAIETLNNRVVNGRPMKVCEDRGKNAGPSAGGGEGGEGGEEGNGRFHQWNGMIGVGAFCAVLIPFPPELGEHLRHIKIILAGR